MEVVLSISLSGFVSLVMVCQGFCTVNAKATLGNPADPLCDPWKQLSWELKLSENVGLVLFIALPLTLGTTSDVDVQF